jgi:hypothetical protein
MASLGECLATPFPVFPRCLTRTLATELCWFPELGYGYYPATGGTHIYDEAYFAKYQGYAQTELGSKLNVARIALVARHYTGHLVDIGIGSGAFVNARPFTWGYDVNPAGVAWLKAREKLWNPYRQPCLAMSFWDSLEHIPDFPKLLEQVEDSVFISLPVFPGPAEVLKSKHYRKDEHYWYFSKAGLIIFMDRLGWKLREVSDIETILGRDGIASFAFRRVSRP